MQRDQAILEVHGLEVSRGEGASQHRVLLPQLHLKTGELLAIHGPSGCGKSTVLEALGLLLKPAQLARFSLAGVGNIERLMLAGCDAELTPIRGSAIGFVLQTGGLLPFLTVAQNISLQRRHSGLPASSALVDAAIECLGIKRLLALKPSALSIGERQRVAFVRAIAHEPTLVLADEPTSALDPTNARALFKLFKEEVIAPNHMAALVVSHDQQLLDDFEVERLHAHVEPGCCYFEQAVQSAAEERT